MVAIAPVKQHLQLYNHDATGLDITQEFDQKHTYVFSPGFQIQNLGIE